MIKSRIFIRFALLGILVSGFFLVLSIFTTHWMRSLIFDEPFRDRGPFRAMETLIDRIPPDERVAALQEMRPGGPRKPPHPQHQHKPPPEPPRDRMVEMVLLDASGAVVHPTEVDEGKLAQLRPLVDQLLLSGEERIVGDEFTLRKLSGEPTQFIARSLRFRPPPPLGGTLLLLNSVQLASIIAAVMVSISVIFYSLRKRSQQADAVMRELSRGNLKARIPITKMDEVGQVMFSFNKMADEIEHLIEHLRKTENSRRDLLRELAHDLRTPVASLKSLIETVTERVDQLPKEKLRELLDLAMREADYFEGLVDDLLFLGRVGEPKYKTAVETFDLSDLVRVEIETIAARYPQIHIDLQTSDDRVIDFDGDPGLIKRLVRNALENAVSFARKRVSFELNVLSDVVEVIVSDDGPGFDAKSLASFGQRKYSRAVTQQGSTSRISIGLGSVIMKSIVDVHRGDLTASNRLSASGDVLGASVSIRMPIS